MPKQDRFDEPRISSTVTVQEALDASSSAQVRPLKVAWNLVAQLRAQDSDFVLALAIGCLCLALAQETGEELEEPPESGWLS